MDGLMQAPELHDGSVSVWFYFFFTIRSLKHLPPSPLRLLLIHCWFIWRRWHPEARDGWVPLSTWNMFFLYIFDPTSSTDIELHDSRTNRLLCRDSCVCCRCFPPSHWHTAALSYHITAGTCNGALVTKGAAAVLSPTAVLWASVTCHQ